MRRQIKNIILDMFEEQICVENIKPFVQFYIACCKNNNVECEIVENSQYKFNYIVEGYRNFIVMLSIQNEMPRILTKSLAEYISDELYKLDIPQDILFEFGKRLAVYDNHKIKTTK